WRLALGVLRCLAGPLETDLLSLLDSRIARQKLRPLQNRAQLVVGARQGTSDAMADRTGLARDAAAHDLDEGVVPLERGGQPQGQLDVDLVESTAAEVFAHRLAVDGDVAGARIEPHPRDGGLTPAGSVVIALLLFHRDSLNSRRLSVAGLRSQVSRLLL